MGNLVKNISNNNYLKIFFLVKTNKQTNVGNSIISTITQNIKGGSNKNNKKKRAKKAKKAKKAPSYTAIFKAELKKKAKNAFRSLIPDDTDSIKID